MAGLYHVNPTTGEPGRCQAHHGKCPFNTDGSGVNHFNTKNEVINASEHIIENQETENGGGITNFSIIIVGQRKIKRQKRLQTQRIFMTFLMKKKTITLSKMQARARTWQME